ncbi:MAG TPA: hypothetical protein DDZ51_01505 [Planctomycetaceae bacterium]|nr:hypothetical protein [Planctomycetaceae bacterium]
MFQKLSIAALVVFTTIATNLQTASAQTTDTQTFTVVVPTSISITAPNNAVQLTHDLTDNPQQFPPQAWLVRGNVGTGVTVAFTAGTPFVHTTDASSKRDLKLDVAVGSFQGPAYWSVEQETASTNYLNNEDTATVTVSSNGAGRASLNLTVSFITDEFGSFINGDYVSTITGTIASN